MNFDITDRQKRIMTFGVLGFLALLVVIYFFACRGPAPAEESEDASRTFANFDLTAMALTPSTPAVFPTQTSSVPDGEVWIFEDFTGETITRSGNGRTYEHEYATFRNEQSGRRIRAWCASPNGPSPKKLGLEYYRYRWDRSTNILVPLKDSPKGDLQRFWEPAYIN